MSSHPKFQPVSGELYGEALDRIAELEAKVAEQANLAAEQYDRGVQEGNKQAEAELEAERDALKGQMQELQWENERLFVSLKGKGVRERLYHALKALDEMAALEGSE